MLFERFGLEGVLLMVSGVLVCLIASILLLQIETGQRSLEDSTEPAPGLTVPVTVGE
jgi:hypothetical protein